MTYYSQIHKTLLCTYINHMPQNTRQMDESVKCFYLIDESDDD